MRYIIWSTLICIKKRKEKDNSVVASRLVLKYLSHIFTGLFTLHSFYRTKLHCREGWVIFFVLNSVKVIYFSDPSSRPSNRRTNWRGGRTWLVSRGLAKCQSSVRSCTKRTSDRLRPASFRVGGLGCSSVGRQGRTRRGKFVTIWNFSGVSFNENRKSCIT